MRRAAVVAAVAVLLLGISGCSAPYPQPQNLPADVIKAARASDKAPKDFRDGVSRTSCGEVVLGQGEKVPIDAIECLNSAIGAADAELAVVAPTTEGDPIVTFYRTSADGEGVDVYVDSTYDRYGTPSWGHERYPDARDITTLRGYPAGW